MGYKIVKDSNEHNNKIKKSSNIMKAVKITYYILLAITFIITASIVVDAYILRGLLTNVNNNGIKDDIDGGNKNTLMEVSELIEYASEEHIGERVSIIGFMCEETGEDIGICWVTDRTFTSIEETNIKVRVRRDEVIQYTPYAVVVSGRLFYDEAESEWGIHDSSIYLYDGEKERYANANNVIRTGVLDLMLGIFSTCTYESDRVYDIEEALKEIGQNELSSLISMTKECIDSGADDRNMSELYDKFIKIMREL